jgi:hypothetical protein
VEDLIFLGSQVQVAHSASMNGRTGRASARVKPARPGSVPERNPN